MTNPVRRPESGPSYDYVPAAVRLAGELQGDSVRQAVAFPLTGRARAELSELPVTRFASNWEKQRQTKIIRERITLYAWIAMLVFALVFAGRIALHP